MSGTHTPGRAKGAAPGYALPKATPNKVTFIVPGNPLSVNRVHGIAYKNGKRVMYFTPEGRRFKLAVAAHALAALSGVTWDKSRRFELTLVSYFSNPRSDSDNPLKVVKDSLQGVLYENDNQVVADHTRKFLDKAAPRLVCTVETIDAD